MVAADAAICLYAEVTDATLSIDNEASDRGA